MRFSLFLFLLVISFTAAAVFAQPTEPIKASLVPGEVVSISDKTIVIKTRDSQLNVELSAKTEFKRVAAEKPSITSATPAQLSEIAIGDKVIVSGVFGANKTNLPARTVYLMSQSDIAQRNAKDAQRW